MTNNYSMFNDPKHYASELRKKIQVSNTSEAVFSFKKDEKIVHTDCSFFGTSLDELKCFIDNMDTAIIEEVARSKFLTSLQIYQLLMLRGIEVTRQRLRKRVLKLMKYRILQENELRIEGTSQGIKYYELDVQGFYIARERGILFHMGNRYLSYNKKVKLGLPDDPINVKRVIVGNQIILGMLLSNAKMERFGIMETLRLESDGELNGCIIRTAATVKIDSESILIYEVVRDFSEAYINLADKVERYFKIIHNKEYLKSNHNRDTAYPQLVICGESLGHNRKIANYLKSQGLWNKEDTILFTEDLLNLKNHSLKSIYELTDNNELRWYILPENQCNNSGNERCLA